jgi:hypothetical protein
MTISLSVDALRDLTVFTVEGELSFEEQVEVLRIFYGGDPTTNVLWDFRNITGNRIQSEEASEIVSFIKRNEAKRPSGKTALVVSTDLDFGLSRVSQAYGESEGLPWEIRAFRSMESAYRWIDGRDE